MRRAGSSERPRHLIRRDRDGGIQSFSCVIGLRHVTSRQLHVTSSTVTVDKNASRDAMGFSATDAAALRPYADNVMIAGVKSKPELNGKLGMIVGTFDQQSGRIPVLVEGEPAAISLKPENLEPSEHISSANS